MSSRISVSKRFAVLLLAVLLLTACDGARATPTPLSGPAPTAGVTVVHTPTPTVALISEETTARQLRVFEKLWTTVRDTYVYPDFNGLDWDDVGRRYRAQIEAGLSDEDFYQAMRDMVDALGDEHSVFNSPQEVAEEEERISGQLDYVGIGIYVTTLLDKGYGVLLQVFPDSPAAQAGLQAHDLILAVDGVPAVGKDGTDNLELLTGPEGSQVRLTVQTPAQEPRDLVITRARIHTQLQVWAWRYPGTNIGYLLIPTFWDQTIAERTRQALETLMDQGDLDGLIVDMRINGGGLDTALRDTLALFTHGELGRFVGRDAERPLVVDPDPVGNSQEVPLVVLVGRETMSFGEVFCGVLQEQGRAFVIGRTSEGNVETLWQTDFEDGSQAWIAVETFRPPSGADWETTGIVPDHEIPLDWDEFTFDDDPQLEAAVDWLLVQVGP